MEFFAPFRLKATRPALILRSVWPSVFWAGFLLLPPTLLDVAKDASQPIGGYVQPGTFCFVIGTAIWLLSDVLDAILFFSYNRRYHSLILRLDANGVVTGLRASSCVTLDAYVKNSCGPASMIGFVFKLLLLTYYCGFGFGLLTFRASHMVDITYGFLGIGALFQILLNIEAVKTLLYLDKSTKQQFILRLLIFLLGIVSSCVVVVALAIVAEDCSKHSEIKRIQELRTALVAIGSIRSINFIMVAWQSSEDGNAIPSVARILNAMEGLLSSICYTTLLFLVVDIIPLRPLLPSPFLPFYVDLSVPYNEAWDGEGPGFQWLYSSVGHILFSFLSILPAIFSLICNIILVRIARQPKIVEEHSKFELSTTEDELELHFIEGNERIEIRQVAYLESVIRRRQLLWTLSLHAKPMEDWDRVEVRIWLAHFGLLRFCRGCERRIEKKKTIFSTRSVRSRESSTETPRAFLASAPARPQRRFSIASLAANGKTTTTVFSVPSGLQLVFASEEDLTKEFGIRPPVIRQRLLLLRQWWRMPALVEKHTQRGWERISPADGAQWLRSIGFDGLLGTILHQFCLDGALLLVLKRNPEFLEQLFTQSFNEVHKSATLSSRRRSILQRAKRQWKKLRAVFNSGGMSVTISEKRLNFLENSFFSALKLLSYAKGRVDKLDEWRRMKYAVAMHRTDVLFQLRAKGFHHLEGTGLHGALFFFGDLTTFEIAEAITPPHYRTKDHVRRLEETINSFTPLELPDPPEDEVILGFNTSDVGSTLPSGSGSEDLESRPLNLPSVFPAAQTAKLPRSSTL